MSPNELFVLIAAILAGGVGFYYAPAFERFWRSTRRHRTTHHHLRY